MKAHNPQLTVGGALRWKVSYYALAEVPQWAVRSICLFVFAGFSRAESPEGGGFFHGNLPYSFSLLPTRRS
jgi:hypothetical protein